MPHDSVGVTQARNNDGLAMSSSAVALFAFRQPVISTFLLQSEPYLQRAIFTCEMSLRERARVLGSEALQLVIALSSSEGCAAPRRRTTGAAAHIPSPLSAPLR